ncbi:DUF2515 family protein [Rossellomorea vietnamensis]|uniref:DUF2515 domain-containing protein n=1 Tax=Rossellomorea vietnamensis TaxID=218284 RepID=A0A6I6UG66_9BACI|nr:DUF2515 family protein [Rossellomorea vietnamensis]QHE61895.1 DUF2515 domain-containing protein [Rossellomorea vietnamensis]
MGYSPFQVIPNLLKPGKHSNISPLLDVQAVNRLYGEMKQEPVPYVYFPEEQALFEEIFIKVKKGNVNNLTRTSSYLDLFKRHPELHWSFLAHMVSRNAGYHMTDIHNDLLSHLMSHTEQQSLFEFLEQCNAAIFEDAYPQLLLYENWKLTGRHAFHLLKKFNVSIFMRKLWADYLKTGNHPVLTTALIMNEQHLIQNKILSSPDFNMGIEKWKFFLQDRLEFTSILFPYGKQSPYSLAGLSVSHFEKVDRRIQLGKKLYRVLFHPNVYPTALSFSLHHPHTGSREDYWPHIYSTVKKRKHLFSPELRAVWENVHYDDPSSPDWFREQPIDVMSPLLTMTDPHRFSMTRKWKARTTILLKLKRD